MIFDDKESFFKDNLNKYRSIRSELGVTERVVGFAPVDWSFIKVKYKGNVKRPKEINLFEEMICKILAKKKYISIEELAGYLGFTGLDQAFIKAIVERLIMEGNIRGTAEELSLTDSGNEFLQKGAKVEYVRDQLFELVFDRYDPQNTMARRTMDELSSIEINDRTWVEEEIFKSLSDYNTVCTIAEIQAPHIHHPKKDFLLDTDFSFMTETIKAYKSTVIASILYDFEDQSMRLVFFSTNGTKRLNYFTEIAAKNEELKNRIIASLNWDRTKLSKSEFQQDSEKASIALKQKINVAEQARDHEELMKLQTMFSEIKRTFNTLEFEEELAQIFQEVDGELWIFSPWIKKGALNIRKSLMEGLLKRGVSLFLLYSENEKNSAPLNIDYESEATLNYWEGKYSNLFFSRLKPFHSKKMYVIDKDSKHEYIGSYNILSFSPRGNLINAREESMCRMAWDSDSDKNFKSDLINVFSSLKETISMRLNDYLNAASQNMDKKQLEQIQKKYLFQIERLRHFRKYNIDSLENQIVSVETNFHDAYTKLLNKYRTQIQIEISKIEKTINTSGNKKMTEEQIKDLERKVRVVKNQSMPDFNKLNSRIEILEKRLNDSKIDKPT